MNRLKSALAMVQDEKGMDEREEKIVDDFYKHLKQPKIEDFSTTPYCDTEGKNTVGAGLRIPQYKDIADLTLTSKKEPISADNPAWSEPQKQSFLKQLNEFCNNKQNRNLSPKGQFDRYQKIYHETVPYFQADELDARGKDYIRQNALPEAIKNVQNVGIDFYNDLTDDGQRGFLDMQYNLGGNKFKLIDLYDPEQIKKSSLQYKNELSADPESYRKPEIYKDLTDHDYWPKLSMESKNRNPTGMARESHRKDISTERNDQTRGYFEHAFKNPWKSD